MRLISEVKRYIVIRSWHLNNLQTLTISIATLWIGFKGCENWIFTRIFVCTECKAGFVFQMCQLKIIDYTLWWNNCRNEHADKPQGKKYCSTTRLASPHFYKTNDSSQIQHIFSSEHNKYRSIPILDTTVDAIDRNKVCGLTFCGPLKSVYIIYQTTSDIIDFLNCSKTNVNFVGVVYTLK